MIHKSERYEKYVISNRIVTYRTAIKKLIILCLQTNASSYKSGGDGTEASIIYIKVNLCVCVCVNASCNVRYFTCFFYRRMNTLLDDILKCVRNRRDQPRKPACIPISSVEEMDAFENINQNDYSDVVSEKEKNYL